MTDESHKKARRKAFAAGFRLRELGQLQRAQDAFVAALHDYPEHVAGWLALGGVVARLRRFGAAADILRRAVELRPTEHLISGALFHALLEDDRVEEAVAEARRFLALDPTTAKYDQELLQVYRDWDEDADALTVHWLRRTRDV